MEKILEIKNLTKNFYTLNGEIEAIKDISFDVYDKEFLSIVGSSGCGKSTLLNIISYLDTQTSGNFKYQKEKPIIGYMLQEDALLPWLTILDNALLGLELKHIKTEENINYVKKLLNTYGLKDFLDKYPDELSGGMKQRVALIRTLGIKPDILLLDEPFSALDYQSRLAVSNDVYEIIKKEKKTAIMISHDIAESISLSDRIIVLSKRPSIVKNIYEIKLSNKSTPIENRKAKEFSYYYEKIWQDLDVTI
jgi:NitT/TauT family transport system ATP-binding protein